jgi:2'-5' RNA ligase
LREQFDPAAQLGVPAHITVLYPFMPPELITDAVLENVRIATSATCQFEFSLVRAERFPSTLYLAPEPPAQFIALTESIAGRFPEFPPYGGQFSSIVPHLTVAQGSESQIRAAEASLLFAMQTQGAVTATCTALVLIENSTGRWREMNVIPIARGRQGA